MGGLAAPPLKLCFYVIEWAGYLYSFSFYLFIESWLYSLNIFLNLVALETVTPATVSFMHFSHQFFPSTKLSIILLDIAVYEQPALQQ